MAARCGRAWHSGAAAPAPPWPTGPRGPWPRARAPAAGQAAGVADASTSGVTNVSYSSAILYGDIDAKGAAPTTFQYGTTNSLRRPDAAFPRGQRDEHGQGQPGDHGPAGDDRLSLPRGGVRSGRDGVGKDRTFTTGKIPLSLQLVGSPNPVVFGSPFFVEGTLSGTGAANHAIVLQANPFPYVGGFQNRRQSRADQLTRGLLVPISRPARKRPAARRHGRLCRWSSARWCSRASRCGSTFHVRATAPPGFVRLYGTVTPAELGAQVGFQLLKPGQPRSIRVAPS